MLNPPFSQRSGSRLPEDPSATAPRCAFLPSPRIAGRLPFPAAPGKLPGSGPTGPDCRHGWEPHALPARSFDTLPDPPAWGPGGSGPGRLGKGGGPGTGPGGAGRESGGPGGGDGGGGGGSGGQPALGPRRGGGPAFHP